MVKGDTAGSPMDKRKWVRLSLRNIKMLLEDRIDIKISPATISRILKNNGYSLKSNVKEKESRSNHPDRNTQFEYIRYQTDSCIESNIPIISIDTKKKELVGNFKNNGKQWCLFPEEVNVHDFLSDALGIAIPYGIYDIACNEGFVNIGITNDTAEFAVDSICKWWEFIGRKRYRTNKLVILADCGGSNGSRSRLFKWYIQTKLCEKYGLEVTVNHYPTGCSKWNPIEHRLFSEISKTWAGIPLRSYEDILKYIRGTKTSTGLKVEAILTPLYYEKGKKVTNKLFSELNIKHFDLCPNWNYTIKSRKAIQYTFDVLWGKGLIKTGS